MNQYELIGFASSLVCVYLNTKANIWGWLWAIISSTVYLILFVKVGLYANAFLQSAFIILSMYGYFSWKLSQKNKTHKPLLPMRRLNFTFFLYTLVVIYLFTVLISQTLIHFSQATLPYLDALTTSISLVAQWLLAQRYVENWLFWIVANILYVVLYYYTNFYLTALLYAIFLGLAIWGYLQWKKQWKTEI
ncbi:MAG: nicotinamide riboside transporter PnuC [Microscillaceae bacterium]|nr:nicotinamide riboside transporter PnuC [Microscillaceae bacterium]MDW8460893.1 nicotinamide riboside transporter PnuC [Cytophagales bacterium]